MSKHLSVQKGGEKGGPAPKWHTCAQCGKQEPWGPTWQWFGSYAMEEVCPQLIPRLCSPQCRKEFDRRMAAGEVRLPELSKRFPHRVIRRQKGYYEEVA